MHILWIKIGLLHPVDTGGRIRTYQMLRALSREHRVTYLTLDDGCSAPDAVELAKEYSESVVRVPFTKAAKGSPAFYFELLRNLVSPLPYAVNQYRSQALREQVQAICDAGDIDVVVCDFLAPSLNVPDDLGHPTILFQHNVESMIWQRHAAVNKHPLKRAYLRAQWRRMARHERSECARFDQVVAVSATDADVLRDDFGAGDVPHVPTGVDTEYYRPSGAEMQQPYEIVFTGSMDWMPNVDAIVWFADEILPRIRERVPGVSLTVVGRYPPASIRELANTDESITVTGAVPDVRPYIERAAVFVVPIRIGGGTRLKIYEAMAMERAIVSTTIGAEGLPVRDGADIVIADDPESFAHAVVTLLQQPERAAGIGNAAAAEVRANYGWDRVAARFAEVCVSVANRRQQSASSLADVSAAVNGLTNQQS